MLSRMRAASPIPRQRETLLRFNELVIYYNARIRAARTLRHIFSYVFHFAVITPVAINVRYISVLLFLTNNFTFDHHVLAHHAARARAREMDLM